MRHQVSKKMKWAQIGCIILIILGIGLALKEPIKSWYVHHMQTEAIQQPIKKSHGHGDFNYGNVKAITDADVANAATMNAADVIGKIAIPAVGMKLPIFYGIAQNNLLRGAGTMKPDEQMGMGNYCLAGHHMLDGKILFGPLMQVKNGDSIYLTDKTYVYKYQVTNVKTVYETDTSVLNDVPEQRLCTLVTCASGHAGETHRLIVTGTLQWQHVANWHNLKVFEVK